MEILDRSAVVRRLAWGVIGGAFAMVFAWRLPELIAAAAKLITAIAQT